jgi:iron complex outermembrane receptor protein
MPFDKKLLAAAVILAFPALAHAEEPYRLPDVTVKGSRPVSPLGTYSVDLDDGSREAARDSASLLEGAPGAAVVRNGPQTGIVQLRGLSQDRVKVRVDGMEITPACPNHMDPPLHYISPAEVETLQVTAGVTPVSQGGDSIAGTVIAKTAGPRFAAGDKAEFSGRVKGGYSGANNGSEASLSLNLGNDKAAVRYNGDRLEGGDLKYAGGTAKATGYDTTKHELEAAFKVGQGDLNIAFGQHRAKNVGTPSLGMDMIKDDADSGRIAYNGKFDFGTVEARLYQHKIDHVMDNYTLRTYTAAASRMKAPASSDDTGFALGVTLPRGSNTFRIGVDGNNNDFNVYQQSANNPAMVSDLFVNNSRDRWGVYGEWEANPAAAWRTLLGLRADTVKSSAGAIARKMGTDSALDQAAFNNAGRDKTDHNWDLTASARYAANAAMAWEFGFARKTRSPSLVERYLWKPSSTYGSADGRNYLGNVDLKPEVSHQISAGFDWKSGSAYIKPSLFYNRVNDYIQGVAATSPGGVSVLKFSNINAELYGMDGAFGYAFSDAWKLDGVLSYVRGKNRDNSDNLYRIAPLRLTLALDYAKGPWNATAEVKAAARQNKVSAYNGETETGGWGILNLRGAYRFAKQGRVNFGVENLFDKYYADHLSGKNQVNNAALGGDLAVGQRLPSPGRFFYLAAEYGW